MATKILPIELKPLVTSECWNFYKFAIMQTMPEFDVWLASHPKLFINHNAVAFYGESGYLHPISYFSDLLEMHETNVLTVTGDQVIDYVIQQIDNDNYVIIDVDQNKLHDKNATEARRHETMVYGYDTTDKKLIVVLLTDGWKEYRIGFEEFVAAYEYARATYINNRNRMYYRREFHYTIATLKPKYGYTNDNAPYDIILKLQRELDGFVYVKQPYADKDTDENRSVLYTVLGCLPFVAQHLKNIMTQPDILQEKLPKYRLSCLKLCEYQYMLLHSMKWFQKEIDNEPEVETLIKEYAFYCDISYNTVLSFYKYRLTQDKALISKILNNLNLVYCHETEILKKIIPLFIEMYTNHLNKILIR